MGFRTLPLYALMILALCAPQVSPQAALAQASGRTSPTDSSRWLLSFGGLFAANEAAGEYSASAGVTPALDVRLSRGWAVGAHGVFARPFPGIRLALGRVGAGPRLSYYFRRSTRAQDDTVRVSPTRRYVRPAKPPLYYYVRADYLWSRIDLELESESLGTDAAFRSVCVGGGAAYGMGRPGVWVYGELGLEGGRFSGIETNGRPETSTFEGLRRSTMGWRFTFGVRFSGGRL